MEENVQKPVTLSPQKDSFKINIPAKVEDMIRLLCSEIHNVEWSGALFYTYTGSFETNDLVINCEDICVMDIGSGGYTEFTETPTIINYQIEHELLDCQIGLIHSHNNMATFFSGTDTNTLKEEGLATNNFVSLIVNNAGTYTAAITRKVHSIRDIRQSSEYDFFGEGSVDLGSSQYYDDDYEIQYFPLEINKSTGSNGEILARLEEIRESKHKLLTPTKTIRVNPNNNVEHKFMGPSLFESWEKQQGYVNDKSADIPKIDQDIVKSAVLQMVTGSIMVTTKNKIDLKSWIAKIDTVFGARFNSFEDFKYFIDNFVDSVLQTTDTKIADADEGIVALAYHAGIMLEDYRNNRYIEEIINNLDNYLI